MNMYNTSECHYHCTNLISLIDAKIHLNFDSTKNL